MDEAVEITETRGFDTHRWISNRERDRHAFFDSAATWARAGRARLDAIAGMLGHTNVTTTGVYTRIVDEIVEDPAWYLEELMGLS